MFDVFSVCHSLGQSVMAIVSGINKLFTENFINKRIIILPLKYVLFSTVFALNFVCVNLKKYFLCQNFS